MPVTTRDIRDKVFKNSGRGYNKDDVDSFLDEIIDEMNLLCSKIDSLEMHIEAEQAKMKSISAVSKSADQIMADAKNYSHQIIKEAKDLAGSIVKDAQDKAELLLKNARSESKQQGSADEWHAYPGFEDDLQAITGQTQPAGNNTSMQQQARKPEGFSFDDLDFEKDLSSSKENIREALLTDLGLENKANETDARQRNDLTPKALKDEAEDSESFKTPGIDQDDYYNLLYGPGPASKLDIYETGKTHGPSTQEEVPQMNMEPRQEYTQEDARRMPRSAEQKREPIPFPGASAEMQDERDRALSPPKQAGNGLIESNENILHRRKVVESFEDERDEAPIKSGKSNVHFALMPLEIEERKPLQRYSTNLDGFAHLRDDSDFGYASEKFRSKK